MLALPLELLRVAKTLWRDPSEWDWVLGRAAGRVNARWVLRGAERGHAVTVMGPIAIENRGRLVLGDRVFFMPGVLATTLDVGPGAELTVGDDTGFAYGASVKAKHRVSLGRHVLVASQVIIEDAADAPVVIGDNVWLAHGCRVRPGVTIGDGSAVSAGTTVTKDVPPRHLAIGSPARNVRLETLSRSR